MTILSTSSRCLAHVFLASLFASYAMASTDICQTFKLENAVQTLDIEQVTAGIDIANDQASQLIDLMQEARGGNLLLAKLNETSSLEDLTDMGFLQAYVLSAAPFVGPVAALLVIALIVCPCFTIARCCCTKRCCKPKKLKDEYSTLQVCLPIFFYMLFALVSSVLAIVAVSNMNAIYGGVVGTVCEVDLIIDDASSMLNSLSTPLGTISSTTIELVDSVNDTLEDAGNIGDELDQLVVLLNKYSADVSSISLPQNASSDALAGTASTINDTVASLEGAATPFLSEIDNIKSNIGGKLAGAQSAITGIVNSSAGVFSGIDATLNVISEDIIGVIKASIGMGLQYGTIAAYAFYSIVFLALAAGVVVLIMYFLPGNCTNSLGSAFLNLSWFLSYLFMLLLLLLGLVYLTLSIVLSDVCDVAYDIPNDFPKYFSLFMPEDDRRMLSSDPLSSLDPAALVAGCFAVPSIPLLTALNITGSFDVNSILSGFSFSFNETIAINVTQLYEFESTMDSLQPSDFGITPTTIATAIESLNNLTSSVGTNVTYTETDCTVTNACDRTCLILTTCAPYTQENNNLIANSTLESARNAIIDLVEGYAEINDILTWLRANATAIVGQTNKLLSAVNHSLNDLDSITGSLGSITDEFEAFAAGGNCSFIAERYYNLHEYLCQDTFQGFYLVSLFNIAIAVFAIPIIITSVCINIRMFGVGGSDKDATVHAWNAK